MWRRDLSSPTHGSDEYDRECGLQACAPKRHLKKAPRHPLNVSADDGVFPVRAGTGKEALPWRPWRETGLVRLRGPRGAAAHQDIRLKPPGRMCVGAPAARDAPAVREAPGEAPGTGRAPGGSRQSRPMSSRMSRITRTTPRRPLGP